MCVFEKQGREYLLGANNGRDLVKPNAVNGELFKKPDKDVCRQRLGFPQDAFIISFVGAFIERKKEQIVLPHQFIC